MSSPSTVAVRSSAAEATLSPPILTLDELEECLSRPTPAVLQALRRVDSDLVVLGAGGKMGPTLARMAARGFAELGLPNRVYAVARFSQPALRERMESWGVDTLACDLLDRGALAALPDAGSVIYMAGQKFGTTGAPAVTWAFNTWMPGLVAERYAAARMVVFSTGNVYPYVPVVRGGACEQTAVDPVGEYGASCVGRERIFEYFSATQGLRCAVVRLNYAVELRYGVLVDVAQKVLCAQPIDLSAGAFNAIWQGDANAQALALLDHCSAPPFVLNVTGPETISLHWVASRFGDLFGCKPQFVGSEAPTALLANSTRAQQMFGYPTVSLNQMVEWIADWLLAGGSTLARPTHFETRDGRY